MPIAFGTDVVISLQGQDRGTMSVDFVSSFKAAGIPAPDILRMMTVNAARLLGIDKQRGTLEEGLAADIIAVPGDPLADIDALRQVVFVMKNGRIIRQENGAPDQPLLGRPVASPPL